MANAKERSGTSENNKRLSKKLTLIIVSLILISAIIFITVWVLIANKALEINSYTLKTEKLGSEFNGYRIAHISDIHNAEIGKDNEKLIKKLKTSCPDIIVITGDLIDSRKTNIDISVNLAKEAISIAPCYYVTGNHESRIEEYDALRDSLKEIGVTVLENDTVSIKKGTSAISISGINDPSFYKGPGSKSEKEIVKEQIEALHTSQDSFTLLLSHRPELFPIYAEYEFDLVLSGHAHGGQFRLPGIGGLFAPNQGFFPKYDEGLFESDNTRMIVSRGIGNSLFPFRLNNKPEIILIELLTY